MIFSKIIVHIWSIWQIRLQGMVVVVGYFILICYRKSQIFFNQLHTVQTSLNFWNCWNLLH